MVFFFLPRTVHGGAARAWTMVHEIAEPQRTPPDFETLPFAPRRYVAYRASPPISIDGRLDDLAWAAAPWSEPFIDIEGDVRPRPRFATRARMLWDDDYFYVAAEMEGALRDAAADAGIEVARLAGVGVGSPGTIEDGVVRSARNLPDWEGEFPLAQTLQRALGCEVSVANRTKSGFVRLRRSMLRVPKSATTNSPPKKTSDLASPRASTCAPAQSMTPHMIGWRVMRITPRAGSSL